MKPYLTDFERQSIRYKTTIGALSMLRLRWMQLGKAIYKALPNRLKNILK